MAGATRALYTRGCSRLASKPIHSPALATWLNVRVAVRSRRARCTSPTMVALHSANPSPSAAAASASAACLHSCIHYTCTSTCNAHETVHCNLYCKLTCIVLYCERAVWPTMASTAYRPRTALIAVHVHCTVQYSLLHIMHIQCRKSYM